MKASLTITIISWLTIVLVGLLALGGFALSYHALWDVATANGLPWWAAPIWPLLVDAALVVFSIAVVRAYLKMESTAWPWILVGVFTFATIGFNLVHAGGSSVVLSIWRISLPIKYIVAIVPPLALFLAFETGMGMIKSDVRRSKLSHNLADLDKITKTKQADLDKLTRTIEDKRIILEDIEFEIKTKYEQSNNPVRQPVVILGVEPDNLKNKPAQRQVYIGQLVRQLRQMGVDDSDIQETALETFNISAKTFDRDLKALNGSMSTT